MSDDRPRVTVLVNVVAPYRVPVFEALARRFQLTILYGGGEDNRTAWSGFSGRVANAEVRRSRGVVIKWPQRSRGPIGGVFEERYFHITFGYIVDLCRSRPDAIITNEMGVRTLIALVVGALMRRPVWVSWEGPPHTERGIGSVRRVVRRVVKHLAARWISYGEGPTAYLLQLGVDGRRILQLQNCVDERQFCSRPPRAFDLHPKPVLLCVGRLVGRKGVYQLLDAAAAVQHEGKSFTLLFVGNGPERESLERKAQQLGLTSVHFVAEVQYSEMAAVYASADVMVFPTLRDVWGLVINEAMWCGVPVIASTLAGAAPELLPPECLFDPHQPSAFRHALRQAIAGRIPKPDLSRLQRIDSVARCLVQDVCSVLNVAADEPANA